MSPEMVGRPMSSILRHILPCLLLVALGASR
ncbi:MAG: hypothetical protein H6Q04_2507, partial [Acidobacteria bacterium]|nr:hypothetical protein [Acidobacteriota bacterium]